MTTFTLSIEPVDAPAYQHGFHLGTDERTARAIAEEAFHKLTPKHGTAIRTVALLRGGKLFDCYDGKWSSDALDALYDSFYADADRWRSKYREGF